MIFNDIRNPRKLISFV